MNNSSFTAVIPVVVTPLNLSFAIFSLVGFIANTLVIIVVSGQSVIPSKISRILLINQLVSEWLCCILRSLDWLIDEASPLPENIWGTFFCKLMYNRPIYFTAMHATYTNIVLLTVERYVAVVHPSQHKKFTAALLAFIIFLSWSTGAVRCFHRYYEPNRRGTTCVVNPLDTRVLSLVVLFWSFIIPLITIACLNGGIIYSLKKNAETLAASNVNPLRRRLQRDLTYSVIIICVTYCATSVPLATVYLLMTYDIVTRDFKGMLYQIVTFVGSSFFVVNPFICILQMAAVRRRVLALLRCSPTRDRPNKETQNPRSESNVRQMEVFSTSNSMK